MTSRDAIQSFLRQQRFAVVGVSRSLKFGNLIYREMKNKKYSVVPVNPYLREFKGEPCYPSLSAAPEPVDAIVVATSRSNAVAVVQETIELGVRHIWLQQGAESNESIQLGADRSINLITGECILMFLEPVTSIHRFHRWIWRWIGKYPQ